MIYISSQGICGEDDFRLLQEKEARTSGGTDRIVKAQRCRYDADMLNFQGLDKSRFIAVLCYQLTWRECRSIGWLIKCLIKLCARFPYYARRWYMHAAPAFPLYHDYLVVLAWGP
jgi:hypothetical protein